MFNHVESSKCSVVQTELKHFIYFSSFHNLFHRLEVKTSCYTTVEVKYGVDLKLTCAANWLKQKKVIFSGWIYSLVFLFQMKEVFVRHDEK